MNGSVAVVGAGSWGTALAMVLADNGYDVRLWARRQEVADEITYRRTNEKYLPHVRLPEGIRATSDLQSVIEGQEHIFVVVPSGSFRETVRMMVPYVREDAFVAHATKGFDIQGYQRMSEVLQAELTQLTKRQIAVVSGPSHAEEVSRRLPTTVVVASAARATAERIQNLLMNNSFRVYTNPDVIGTELGGALKNIIALGCGLSDGLGFGDNAKAALMTRGLAEISRLGVKMGAAQLTFTGLAGVGDLVVTCTSQHSRNWRAGFLLGKGEKLDAVLRKMNMVVEGVRTTEIAYRLSAQYDVEMPITRAIYQVLFEGKEPMEAVEDLMERGRTHEMEEVARAVSLSWES
ncbi:glycerol-3-phosphate dehydrogenase [NAD(P)+] [Collibacillus ludicampi]|jgi:glycerol-3-phosphate dehydrogenase (NAD(P)+)|uniref:Glycerol-3-phosphate dehydrogenase [NAD(P)+] n=1 Tax=Collibacillus ludicampi TaxID=2771369 RepID=A0AAV4LK34_9BACL|nr:NAD(P)H-dependent glycerol-3-phosphate dehydrogenase [Collibacillus ludicampi]GIM48206.1 glycerol-3-phosphate dehydrogenase [NAD(P)+] [Collibacillus ludicampi]